MEIVEALAPEGFTDLHAIITEEELAAISEQYKQKAGFAPETLNARPSLSVR